MKKLTLPVLFFFFGFSALLHAQDSMRPEVGPLVEAYEGPKSEAVWIARIGPKSANEVIMQITGIDHPLNKKIFKCSVDETGRDKRYTTTIAGQPFVILILGSTTSGELYLPQEKNTVRVTYNRGLSSQGNPEAFLTDYLQQSDTQKVK